MDQALEYHVQPLVWVYGEERVAELIRQLETEGWRHPATQCIEDADGCGLNILIMSRPPEWVRPPELHRENDGHVTLTCHCTRCEAQREAKEARIESRITGIPMTFADPTPFWQDVEHKNG